MATWLTRGTVWLALGFYVASVWATARTGPASTAGRILSSFGCAAFLGHVAAAFHFHHHWSHAAAEAETARQTAALVGWNWGGGIYLNYIFALVWLTDVAWAWNLPRAFQNRPAWLNWAVRAFFLFMMFNGAVVFVTGPQRWLGLLLCALLVLAWWWPGKRMLKRSSDREGTSTL